jgi:hypothetical protein
LENKDVPAHTKRAQEMFTLVEKYLSSGMKQKQFCQQESITYSTFHWWLHEYRHRDDKNVSKPSSKKFVKLPSLNSTVLCQHSFSIEYPNGITLRFSGPVDVQVISQLVQVLR